MTKTQQINASPCSLEIVWLHQNIRFQAAEIYRVCIYCASMRYFVWRKSYRLTYPEIARLKEDICHYLFIDQFYTIIKKWYSGSYIRNAQRNLQYAWIWYDSLLL